MLRSPPEPSASAESTEPSHLIMEQAAEWYALLTSEDATSGDQRRWQAWLESSAEHRSAWQYVESVSRSFAPIQRAPDPRKTAEGVLEANGRLIKRRNMLASIAGLAGAGLLGWASWHTPLPRVARAWQSDYHTDVGDILEIDLADGTRVWLNTASAINEQFNSVERRVHLVSGEILIDTGRAHQESKARPFYVNTAHGELHALGTRFTVQMDSEHTLVSVYEGAVQASTPSGLTKVIQAGQQILFNKTKMSEMQTANLAREAWSRGVFVAQNIPLYEVVAELRRYRKGHLGLSPEVAQLRVFGNFPLNNTDDALDLLADALPVKVQRTLPWWVSIEAEH